MERSEPDYQVLVSKYLVIQCLYVDAIPHASTQPRWLLSDILLWNILIMIILTRLNILISFNTVYLHNDMAEYLDITLSNILLWRENSLPAFNPPGSLHL